MTAFDGPVVDHWFEGKMVQTANASTVQDQSTMQEDPNVYSRVLYRLSYDPLPLIKVTAISDCFSHNINKLVDDLFGYF